MKDKLKLIDKAITAWSWGLLTDHMAFTVIQLIITPQKPSKAAIQWAKEVAIKLTPNHTGLCMGQFDDTCFDECIAVDECLELYKKEREV